MKTTPRAMWMLIIAGPAIVALEQQVNFVLARHACSAQSNVALNVVALVALVLTVVTALIGASLWKRAGAEWPSEEADLPNRIRFIAALGILSSAISFLVILAQGIATVHFNPCQ